MGTDRKVTERSKHKASSFAALASPCWKHEYFFFLLLNVETDKQELLKIPKIQEDDSDPGTEANNTESAVISPKNKTKNW